jgi:hypothetical protein
MGGINKTRLERPIQLEYNLPENDIDYETGEITFCTGRYGAPLPARIIGFNVRNIVVPIKRKLWTLKPSPPDEYCSHAPAGASEQSSAGGCLGLV